MRLLACSSYYYYGDSQGIEPQFYYLYKVPLAMGMEADFYDYRTAARIDVDAMRRHFLMLVRSGRYDAVFIATNADQFDEETLSQARKHCAVFGWNSDDEYRWNTYSRQRAPWYTFMVTNSPQVYAESKAAFPNLLHAQWACTGFWDGGQTRKDIGFSFVGQVYGEREAQIRWLEKHAGLESFGKGALGVLPFLQCTPPWKRCIERILLQRMLPFVAGRIGFNNVLSFHRVNELWNRTKVSFAPLDSYEGNVRQIKSRVFDMGLSGTLMLAQQAPHLNTYYEPEKEYVPFENLEEAADKVRFYLNNEASRKGIAEAYQRRTRAEHLWRHRIEHVLKEAGIPLGQ